MSTNTITPDHQAREDQLRRWNEAYASGNPLVPDAIYDQTWREHKFEREHAVSDDFPSPTILDEVGCAPRVDDGFVKVKHVIPMLSLDNIFEKDEGSAEKWFKDIELELGFPVFINVEPKIDGIALKLTYIDDILRSAVTRGDGETGDDVISNVLAAKLVPSLLPGEATNPRRILEITGEVYIRKDTFAEMNEKRRAEGLKLWKNPRNSAAGALKLQDQEEVAKRGLSFVAHGLSRVDDSYAIEDNADFVKLMRKVGIACMDDWSVTSSAESATEAVRYWKEKMKDAAWMIPTDGIVFKIRAWYHRERLGTSSRAPKWAVAFKLLPEQAVTTVNAIIVQVGRTGKLTPVAQLEPVLLAGSEVSNASLHNEAQINALGVRVGDKVIVHKAAEIIPEIVSSITYDEVVRTAQAEVDISIPYMGETYTEQNKLRADLLVARINRARPPFNLVDHIGGKCPWCKSTMIEQIVLAGRAVGKGSELPNKNTSVNWFCRNADCGAQLATRIEHFGARKTLDIANLGESLAVAIARAANDSAAEECAIYGAEKYPSVSETLLHLFALKADFFAELAWDTDKGTAKLGMVRAEQVVAGFQRALAQPLHRWLWAVGIPSVGEGTSKEIARLFRDADDLAQLEVCVEGKDEKNQSVRAVWALIRGVEDDPDVAALQINTNQLGNVSANALVEFVRSKDGKLVLEFWRTHSLQSSNYAPLPPVASSATPLAGKSFVITGTLSKSRDLIKADIEAAGGKVGSGVSAKTDYLVLGENGGSKAEKADKLNVPSISEEQLLAMIAGAV